MYYINIKYVIKKGKWFKVKASFLADVDFQENKENIKNVKNIKDIENIKNVGNVKAD